MAKIKKTLAPRPKPEVLTPEMIEEQNRALEAIINKADATIYEDTKPANKVPKKSDNDPDKIVSFTLKMPRYKLNEIRAKAESVPTKKLFTRKKKGISIEQWIFEQIEKGLSK